MAFKVDLITYEGVYKSFESAKLNVPTSEGRRTILSNHMPIMMPLEIGVIETDEDGILRHYAINGGVLYFKDNVAELVADNVVDVAEIDIERAYRDKEKESERLKKARRENERIRAEHKIEVAENLIRAAEKYQE
ncbi:MAG: ATP synthase F1 subunit epsilon [Erysipelotrichaceae bacterium]|nr:ATP synthase F1 subunit epsilon [Erysipelotrichaceae bacterium]